MRVRLAATRAMLVAAAFLFSSQIQAQPQDITTAEARAYFEQIQREVTDLMRAKELGRITDWIDRNIADGTVFQVSMNVFMAGKRKGFADLSLEKPDLRALGGVTAGAFQQQNIKDYSLEMAVTDVFSHGSGAATAKVRWNERLIADPAASGAAHKSSDRNGLSIESVADCSHLLQRQEGRLVIGLTTCTAEVRF